MHRLSASGLGRARHCTWWARKDIAIPEQTANRAMAFGNAAHSCFERHLSDGESGSVDVLNVADAFGLDDVDAAKLERTYEQWAAWWPRARGALRWHAEVPLVWDLKSNKVRPVARRSHRDYGALGPYEIPMTVDAIGEGGRDVHVVDWKTGRQRAEAARTNMQLALNGAASALYYGKTSAIVQIVKASEDAVYEDEPETLDALSFEATRDEVAGMVDAVAKSEPHAGPWCEWCPARAVCPSTASQMAEVLDASKLVRREPVSLEIRDNDHAAGMLVAVDAAEAFLTELKKRIRAFADAQGGIAMPDGGVYAGHEVTVERPDLDAPGAVEALRTLGVEAAIETKRSTTWTAIKAAGSKDAERAARAALRGIGAIKASTSRRYEVKATKKERAA